ncbi:MAG: hypothetical protein ACRC6X_02790, partial [Culicoidibacterales bacterium]
ALLNLIFCFTVAVLFYVYLIVGFLFILGRDRLEAIGIFLLFTMFGIVSAIIMFLLFLLIMKPATNETKFEKAYLDGSYKVERPIELPRKKRKKVQTKKTGT